MLYLLLLAAMWLAFKFLTVRMALKGSAPAQRAAILRALAEMFRGGGGPLR